MRNLNEIMEELQNVDLLQLITDILKPLGFAHELTIDNSRKLLNEVQTLDKSISEDLVLCIAIIPNLPFGFESMYSEFEKEINIMNDLLIKYS